MVVSQTRLKYSAGSQIRNLCYSEELAERGKWEVSTKCHFQDRKVRKENTSNIVRVYLQGLNDYESIPIHSSKMLFMLIALQQVKLSSLTKPLRNLLPGSRGSRWVKNGWRWSASIALKKTWRVKLAEMCRSSKDASELSKVGVR
jgi:hypothetical protein